MILNQDLKFIDLPANHQAAFSGRRARKMLLQAGQQFYKFTDATLVRPPRKPDEQPSISPWWSAVEPISETDTGLQTLLDRAESVGVSPATFARARNAVTKQWNSMSGLIVMQLLVPAYGFIGGVAHQPIDNRDEFKNVMFIGGAIQVYIASLVPSQVRKV